MNIRLEALDDTFWENRSEQGSKNGDSERSSEVSIPLNQPNEETQPGNPGRRPKGDIWQYFMEINNGKGKHKGAICNFCHSSWTWGRANEIKSHLAMKCKGHVPKDIRLNFLREIDNERETSETSSTSSKKRKITNNQKTLENYYDIDKIDEVKSNRADKALIRWFVCSGIPFVAADSPYFEDFTKSLNSGYNPPKRTALATTHLDGELANITLKIEKELGKAKNLTLCVDGWASPLKHSIYAFVIMTPERKQYIYSLEDNSYPAGAALRDEIFHTFTTGGNLKTSTKTRWSTAWDCCESLLRNENNIRSVLEQEPQIFVRTITTKNLINDRQFWINVEQLQNLITPVKRAVKDVEFQGTILADVFIELVKMAIAVQDIPAPLNDQFRRDCDSLTHNTFKKVVLRKALEIWKQTGGGETSAKILKSQMSLYKNREPPFDDDFVESVDTVKNWWSSCELKKNEKHIALLALKLHSITPHNASTERVFSVLNWYLCKRRNKINISHLESMAQIHSFLIANASSELNFVKNEISQDEFTAAFSQIAITMEEGIDLFEENDSFPIFDERLCDETEEEDDLQLQNENGLNLEIGEFIQLNVKNSDSINENETDANDSRIEHGDKNFNIEDLLQDD
ncbi:unnamed protein product [Rhizophagus irregularis]|uniref:BED-type domain-containing protein n=1 Tax=Rhizophagus irregularis TaxID=588596 RepID=A0A915Z2N8_9GLOM|nr:unnamed protein product [Rhizophagus irregularis]